MLPLISECPRLDDLAGLTWAEAGSQLLGHLHMASVIGLPGLLTPWSQNSKQPKGRQKFECTSTTKISVWVTFVNVHRPRQVSWVN